MISNKLDKLIQTKTDIKNAIIAKGQEVLDTDTFASYADKILTIQSDSGYDRPSDWLELPELIEGDQKFVGLYAVFPHDSNFIAIFVQNDYTIDWGDGIIQNYSSGPAYHVYDYNAIPLNTECSRGYRQVIVTIIPQSGDNLISIRPYYKYTDSDLQKYSNGWLDIKIVGSNINNLRFGDSYSSYSNSAMLENIEFIGINNISDFTNMFYNCYSLKSVKINSSNGTNFYRAFYYCYSLKLVQLDTSNGTNFSNMFYYCHSLQNIQLNTSNGLNFSNMFYCCYSLQSVQLETSSATNFNRMFYCCYSLQSVPQIDVSSVIDFDYIFYNCYSLSISKILGTKISISYINCRLSKQALFDIFNNLSTVTGQTITITGNWGATLLTTEDRAIATNKGWSIVG